MNTDILYDAMLAAFINIISLLKRIPFVGAVVITFSDVDTTLGPGLIAAISAILGVIAKWAWFQVSRKQIWREFVAAPLASYVFANVQPPLISSWIGDFGKDGPWIIGFLIGVLGLIIVSFISDTITGYRTRKEAQT